MSRGSAGFAMTCAGAPLRAWIVLSPVVVGGMDWVFWVIIVSCRATHAWRRLSLGAWTGRYGIVLCHPCTVRADACTLHPAFLWSTECETGETRSTVLTQKHGEMWDRSNTPYSSHSSTSSALLAGVTLSSAAERGPKRFPAGLGSGGNEGNTRRLDAAAVGGGVSFTPHPLPQV
ncbi:hypothetical protein B0H14DRAFT_2649338 [Mycena olivaceomarginata]|nr:hypothetical protein B0H14DRAFT_2649338 [Mycena olivaceomarginata]